MESYALVPILKTKNKHLHLAAVHQEYFASSALPSDSVPPWPPRELTLEHAQGQGYNSSWCTQAVWLPHGFTVGQTKRHAVKVTAVAGADGWLMHDGTCTRSHGQCYSYSEEGILAALLTNAETHTLSRFKLQHGSTGIVWPPHGRDKHKAKARMSDHLMDLTKTSIRPRPGCLTTS